MQSSNNWLTKPHIKIRYTKSLCNRCQMVLALHMLMLFCIDLVPILLSLFSNNWGKVNKRERELGGKSESKYINKILISNISSNIHSLQCSHCLFHFRHSHLFARTWTPKKLKFFNFIDVAENSFPLFPIMLTLPSMKKYKQYF